MGGPARAGDGYCRQRAVRGHRAGGQSLAGRGVQATRPAGAHDRRKGAGDGAASGARHVQAGFRRLRRRGESSLKGRQK